MITRLDIAWVAVVALGLVVLSKPSVTAAEPYVIFEDSFETPSVTNHPDGKGVMPDGWSREHSYTIFENENNTNLAARVDTPFGEQYLSIWDLSGVIRTNITDTLQPGVTYTLTFNVGNKNGDGNADPAGNDYLAEILAGTNVVASSTGTTDSNDFSQNGVVALTTSGTNAYLGQVISVRLAHDGPDWLYKTLVDNVKLVADESASEWGHTLHIGK